MGNYRTTYDPIILGACEKLVDEAWRQTKGTKALDLQLSDITNNDEPICNYRILVIPQGPTADVAVDRQETVQSVCA